MIPFARILTYGNSTKLEPKVIYGSSEYSNNFYMLKDGVMYVTGANDAGQLGRGNTTAQYAAWLKVPETEKIIAASCGYWVTIYVTITGKVMLAGNSPITSNTTKPQYRTWTDVTSFFPSSVFDMKNTVSINIDRNGVMVINAAGEVFCTGTDSTGWSAQGVVNKGYFAFTKIYDASQGKAVASMCGTGVGRLLLEDNTILSAGSNNAFQCGAMTDLNVITWTKTFPDAIPADIYQFKLCNNMCAIFMKDRTYYCTGMGIYGSFGDGTSSTSNSKFYQGTLAFDIVNMQKYKKLFSTSLSSSTFVVKSDGYLYGCGYRSTNLVSTSDVSTFTLCGNQLTGGLYANSMYMSGNTNLFFYDPYSETLNIAPSSPTGFAPARPTPTIGIGQFVPITIV